MNDIGQVLRELSQLYEFNRYIRQFKPVSPAPPRPAPPSPEEPGPQPDRDPPPPAG